MAQSRHGVSGDIRIPKNHPYRRVRHVSWKDAYPTDHENDESKASEDPTTADAAGLKDGEDEPQVWEF